MRLRPAQPGICLLSACTALYQFGEVIEWVCTLSLQYLLNGVGETALHLVLVLLKEKVFIVLFLDRHDIEWQSVEQLTRLRWKHAGAPRCCPHRGLHVIGNPQLS